MQAQDTTIKSLLDYDFYKLSMAQVQWRRFGHILTSFELTNRTSDVNLLDYIDIKQLRGLLEMASKLSLTEEEVAYLGELGLDPKFVRFMADFKLPRLNVADNHGYLHVSAHGAWPEATFWETIVLSTINQLYCEGYMKAHDITQEQAYAEGMRRLERKIDLLEKYPDIKIIEFGTRRRFSAEWQQIVLENLLERIPDQVIGTSNVHLARKLGIPAVGTYAHEMPMGYVAIHGDLQTGNPVGHRLMLEHWYEEFGQERSIALTDTFGSKHFFKDFADMAADWNGLRHDSGDPFKFGETAIKFYEELGIDPREKMLVFSDGLDEEMIVRLHLHFAGRIQVCYGWGTNLTNDLGIPSLSLVMKLMRARGRKTIKLSDNIAKNMGDSEDLIIARELFDYDVNFFEKCVV